MAPIVTTTLSQNDVLLGRGTGPNRAEGNQKFRYMAIELLMRKNVKLENGKGGQPTEVPFDKLAAQLVSMVSLRNGRFLRKLTKNEVLAILAAAPESEVALLKKKTNKKIPTMYVVVSEDSAIEKAKFCLRYQLRSSSLKSENVARKNKAVTEPLTDGSEDQQAKSTSKDTPQVTSTLRQPSPRVIANTSSRGSDHDAQDLALSTATGTVNLQDQRAAATRLVWQQQSDYYRNQLVDAAARSLLDGLSMYPRPRQTTNVRRRLSQESELMSLLPPPTPTTPSVAAILRTAATLSSTSNRAAMTVNEPFLPPFTYGRVVPEDVNSIRRKLLFSSLLPNGSNQA